MREESKARDYVCDSGDVEDKQTKRVLPLTLRRLPCDLRQSQRTAGTQTRVSIDSPVNCGQRPEHAISTCLQPQPLADRRHLLPYTAIIKPSVSSFISHHCGLNKNRSQCNHAAVVATKPSVGHISTTKLVSVTASSVGVPRNYLHRVIHDEEAQQGWNTTRPGLNMRGISRTVDRDERRRNHNAAALDTGMNGRTRAYVMKLIKDPISYNAKACMNSVQDAETSKFSSPMIKPAAATSVAKPRIHILDNEERKETAPPCIPKAGVIHSNISSFKGISQRSESLGIQSGHVKESLRKFSADVEHSC